MALYVNTAVLFLSCSRGSRELWAHWGKRVVGGGWMSVVGLFGRWWSEVSASPLPPFPALSHPVIRVTVRSSLAPIGHANNSFNNPGPCHILLLLWPRCHAKSPAMEKRLHCREDGMTGWTLSGYVCVMYQCCCIWQTEHSINYTLHFSLGLFVSFLCVHVCSLVLFVAFI